MADGLEDLRKINAILSFHIVTHMTIAGQRLGKHIPEITLSTTEGHQLLGNR
jgi:hypothetical protein